MKRLWMVMLVLACPVSTMAQTNPPAGGQPYQPAVAAPSTTVYGGGGYNGGGGGQTAQGAALQGMSQVISAAGQYNLNTSAAAINMTQAQSNEMRNEVQGVQTFWEKRNYGRMMREAERGPKRTPEELAKICHFGSPKALTAGQIDPVNGTLKWPAPLTVPDLADQRTELDKLIAKLVAYGALDYNEQTAVRTAADAMLAGLKAKIGEIPPQAYTASKNFLQSVVFTATNAML